MSVEVRVLGEIDARIDGRPVDVGHLRQRCVLAVLAVEANRVVSADQLIDRVWGDRPPGGARNSLYSYLTRLRRVLADSGDAAITRRPGGYVLAVDPSMVDFHRFQDLLAEARTADDDDKEALFAQALGLWRGEAFAGLDTPWLGRVRSAVEQERWAAELDHADLRLRRGEHVRLLPQLSARAEQHPLDERLARQLMLAFYRSGRQADALAAFQDTRARLAEELGIDPGPELREMHERILRGDPGLAASAPIGPRRERADAPIASAPHREPLDRASRELATAVRRQWSAEVEVRSLRRPEPVRLRWSSTGRPVSATESAILHGTGDAGHPEKLHLRGDLTNLADAFGKLPAHQLVVLGQPGAGKTVLAMLLTLALLHDPQPNAPTPVLLTLSSWNPDDQHLHTWIARKLVEEYPWLGNARMYGPDAAARLVAEGRVLPVLDGLDEIPPGLHAAAIDALDRAVAGGRPLVVTCRSDEYERAVRESGTLLARAAVVEIEPVTPDDAATFLTGRTRTGDARWQPVARHLADHPHGALARALCTPLMVDLARTAYADPDANPARLCDTTSFSDPAQIEDHLLDSFLPAVYARHPPAPGNEPVTRPGYPPERAQQWLTFLARYMWRTQTRDLAWWQLAGELPRSVRALLFGLPPALLFAITGALAGGPAIGLVYGLSFAVAGCTVGALSRLPGPRRVEVRFHGTAGRFASRFAIGVAIAIGLGIAWSLPYGLTAVLAAVFGAAIAAHVWLDTPTDARRTSSPSVVLDQERISALSFILAVALSLGLFYGLAFAESREIAGATALAFMFDPRLAVAAGVAGALVGWFSFGRPGLAYGLAGAVVAGQLIPRASSLSAAFAAGGVFALAIGLALVASRAWGVYLLTRCWLTARERLPLRLMRFLDDAHHRGVLRNAGAVYQFRHARLQDRLTSQDPRALTRADAPLALAQKPAGPGQARRASRREPGSANNRAPGMSHWPTVMVMVLVRVQRSALSPVPVPPSDPWPVPRRTTA